jgi:Xaa-Pro aminopeptidase
MRTACMLSLWLFFALGAVGAESPCFEPSEYAARRARVMDLISDGITIVRNSERGPRNHDFTYLCGIEIPGAVLIVDGVRKESILFYTTSEHYLKGKGLSIDLLNHPELATGVKKCCPADQFSAVLTQLAGKTRVIHTPFRTETSEPEISTRSQWDGRLTRPMQFVTILRQRFPEVKVEDCSQVLWELRRIKTPAEIKMLRRAAEIGAEAMITVMKAARPGRYEYELSSLFEYVCKRQGCRELAFPTMTISAENHAYLHYMGHNRLLADGDFLVMDAGPKWHGYCTDISISIPIGGKFSPRQREIYQACLGISQGCLAHYRPGLTGYDIGTRVRKMLEKKGYDLTKDTFTRMRFLKEGGITHYVGLVAHDAGGPDLPPDRPLKPGMVFACDVFATYPDENLGVRVENTVLITETGCEVLNRGIPREIDEIEAFLQCHEVDHE